MKQYIGKSGILPAMPVTIIATEADGKINFAPHGQIGTVTAEPSVIYTSVVKEHQTAKNIIQTQYFSVNVPSAALLEKVKFCGSVSGAVENKADQFQVFYGDTHIPMIRDCPVCFVCKVVETLEINGFYLFLGEVQETFADSDCLVESIPNAERILPLLCSIDGSFHTIGDVERM